MAIDATSADNPKLNARGHCRCGAHLLLDKRFASDRIACPVCGKSVALRRAAAIAQLAPSTASRAPVKVPSSIVIRFLHSSLTIYERTLAISPLGDRAALAIDALVHIWDTNSGEEICPFSVSDVHDKGLLHIGFQPDSQFLYTTAWEKMAIWDTFTGYRVARRTEPDSGDFSLAFSENAMSVIAFAGKKSKSLELWNWSAGLKVQDLPFPEVGTLSSTAISPDGRWIACKGSSCVRHDNPDEGYYTTICTSHVAVLDLQGDLQWVIRSGAPDEGVKAFAFCEGRQEYLTCNDVGDIHRHDILGGTRLKLSTIAIGEGRSRVIFSADSRRIITVSESMKEYAVYDTASGTKLRQLELSRSCYSVDVSKDCNTLLCFCCDLWEGAKTFEEVIAPNRKRNRSPISVDLALSF